MAASYWARWMCNRYIPNLPNLILPNVLIEGYDLLACDEGRQVFDRGGVMRKIAWSLNGGRWSDAPIDLTVTYTSTDDTTIANFYWKLSVRPFPETPRQQASFERWIQQQMRRIVAGLNDVVETAAPDEVVHGCTQPQTHNHDHASYEPAPRYSPGLMIGGEATATATRSVRGRTAVQHASALVEESPQCDRCWKPAVAIPGTTGRYYCLTCRRHLPRRASA